MAQKNLRLPLFVSLLALASIPIGRARVGDIPVGDTSPEEKPIVQIVLRMQKDLESLKTENREMRKVIDRQSTDLENLSAELLSVREKVNEVKILPPEKRNEVSESIPSNQRSLQFAQYITRAEYRYTKQALKQLSKRLKCISSDSTGDDLIIEGCNLHVHNGLGRTATTNGKGNLIIGYNEVEDKHASLKRRGSHNLVIGPQHQYTSVGSIISGKSNTVTGMHSSSIGGFDNYVNGDYSCAFAGSFNVVSGHYSAAVAAYPGVNNTVGGIHNGAVAGGSNKITGRMCTAASGFNNTVDGVDNAVIGGNNGTIVGVDNAIVGGYKSNVDGGSFNVIVGGWKNVLQGGNNVAVGGYFASIDEKNVIHSVKVGGYKDAMADNYTVMIANKVLNPIPIVPPLNVTKNATNATIPAHKNATNATRG